jgi:hypothetical protein
MCLQEQAKYNMVKTAIYPVTETILSNRLVCFICPFTMISTTVGHILAVIQSDFFLYFLITNQQLPISTQIT